MAILGYSAYWHSKQTSILNDSYLRKSEIVKEAQKDKNYGTGLDTVLVFYNFEASVDEFSGTDLLKRKIEALRYNSREKSIRVNVFVGFNELIEKTHLEQIEFYYRTTLQALLMVKEKFTKRKNKLVIFDFDELIGDINRGYLNSYPELKF